MKLKELEKTNEEPKPNKDANKESLDERKKRL